jgi:hypothetical protein
MCPYRLLCINYYADNDVNTGFETQQGASRRCSAIGSHLKWYEPDFCPRPENRQNQLWTSATREISTLNVTQRGKIITP